MQQCNRDICSVLKKYLARISTGICLIVIVFVKFCVLSVFVDYVHCCNLILALQMCSFHLKRCIFQTTADVVENSQKCYTVCLVRHRGNAVIPKEEVLLY